MLKEYNIVENTLESEKYFSGKNKIHKILILGSGLSIGQVGEFDYSGSQAIKAKEEILK